MLAFKRCSISPIVRSSPHPATRRKKQEEPFIRKQQLDPSKNYSAGYHTHLLKAHGQQMRILLSTIDSLSDNIKESMGEEWRLKQKNQMIIEEQGLKK